MADAAGIVQFITAQLDEDEAMARKPWDADWALGGNPGRLFVYFADEGSPAILDCDDDGSAEYCVHFQPRRVLAEIAAKRAILDLHGGARIPARCCVSEWEGYTVSEWYDARTDPCPTLRALSAPYAGREGWKEEWAL